MLLYKFEYNNIIITIIIIIIIIVQVATAPTNVSVMHIQCDARLTLSLPGITVL